MTSLAILASKEADVLTGLLWLGGALLAAVVLVVLLMTVIKRYMMDDPPAPESGLVLELDRLRAMRDEGRLTPEEYERLRGRLLGGGATKPGPLAGGPRADNDVQSPPRD